MEGGKQTESQETQGNDCSFVWDDTTQLYFHSRSGFYHATAGWYYSSRDGHYYKFENGSYVLLEHDKVNDCGWHTYQRTGPDNHFQEESSTQLYCFSEDNICSLPADQSDAYSCHRTVLGESTTGDTEWRANQEAEIPCPPPEWLEETLISPYQSGYKQNGDDADVSTMSLEVDGGTSYDCTQMLESGDGISEHHHSECESFIDEDACRDEENWKAQYGQVVNYAEQPLRDLRVFHLWDWEMVTGSRKEGKGKKTRLVGWQVKRSAELHPSMPSSGGLLRTAPILEVHLDLVRVRTGKVYKLHSPSARYLATLSSYDSSNPTKDWGFPEFSITVQAIPGTKPFGKSKQELAEDTDKGVSLSPNELSTSAKQSIHGYRDRAAERRTLHGGFGVGPGQKSSSVDEVINATSPVSTSTEETAAETFNMSFGAGSYARKILESMGWKEGEALGNTKKGLTKPIQAVGNMGNAGLGWPQGRMTK